VNDNKKMLAWLGLMSILAVTAITYFAIKVGGISVGNQQRFRLVFANATGIPDNADIRVYGIKIGTVESMELAPDHGASVWIAIKPDSVVHQDARAVIKSKSLLGERFIELQPGAPKPLSLLVGPLPIQ